MRFGVREICDVVFKAKAATQIGTTTFKAGQPVLYIDTAKTSTLEGAATSVYATGGKGNTRLLTWEGEKTLTFTVEDALLSPIGFAVLSGAGLFQGKTDDDMVHVHTTTVVTATSNSALDLTQALQYYDAKGTTQSYTICKTAPVFVLQTEADGSLAGMIEDCTVDTTGKKVNSTAKFKVGETYFVDYYVTKKAAAVNELQIDAENFGGYYYVEASTLFRDQATGKDMPAEITIPKVKIQSNFTFSMASSGDPSTFTFTMDAMPDYTYFNKSRKVLCVMQILTDTAIALDPESVMPHSEDEKPDVAGTDSTPDQP